MTGQTVAHYGAPETAAPECAARLRRAPFFSAPRSVALYGSQEAPRAPLNSPGEQLDNPRKQPEFRVFHSVDKFFPLCGKTAKSFSGSSRKSVGAFPSCFDSGLMNSPQKHRSKQPHGILKNSAVTRGFLAFKADFKIPASLASRLDVRMRPSAGNARDFHSDFEATSRTPAY